MRYVSWAVFYEGQTDALYLDVLLPRVIRDMVAREGRQIVEVPDVPVVKLGQRDRSVEAVAQEACEFRDALDVIFVHADTGGRALERNLNQRSTAYCVAFAQRCAWPLERCITVTPRHETEAWLLADGAAVTSALGYSGHAMEIGLPTTALAAERLIDPKDTLRRAVESVAGRRRSQNVSNIFPAIAQRQRMELLRHSCSFLVFEERLRNCLNSLRCL